MPPRHFQWQRARQRSSPQDTKMAAPIGRAKKGAAVNRLHRCDRHAPVLHVMNIDHEKLTYFYGGLNNRFTSVVEANVINGIVA